jgi:hypothetical protein
MEMERVQQLHSASDQVQYELEPGAPCVARGVRSVSGAPLK